MEPYTIKTDIEDNILILYMYDIKKSIVCDIKRIDFEAMDNINQFIEFIETIQSEYDIYLYPLWTDELEYVWNYIETKQLNN